MNANHYHFYENNAKEEVEEEEDYIDMEVGSQSSSTIFRSEFEFQKSEKDTAPSPADELFYKGKLLPLHLPPRLQMVEKLLQNTNTFNNGGITPLFTATNNTPIENNTPFESCQVSRELNPEEYFLEYSSQEFTTSFEEDQIDQDHDHDHDQNPFDKKSNWTSRKLKLIKQSTIGSKLKASRAYLKSLFNKTTCSNETSTRNFSHQVPILKPIKESLNKSKKNPFGQIQKETSIEENGSKGGHRRSFSGAIKKRISMARSSSSLSNSMSGSSSSSSSSSSASSSTDSNGFREMQFFKRSNSVNSDVENPIQAAIAHCKRSHHDRQIKQFHSRAIHHEDQRPALCRG